MDMNIPNWQHHSKKEKKRHLKPQALRQARARVRQLKKCLLNPPKRRVSYYNVYIR
jgi:ArsR family metal-binding transcriptional regulator